MSDQLVQIEHTSVAGYAWVPEDSYTNFWGPVEGWTLVAGGPAVSFLPAPMRYRGSYSAGIDYSPGDVVIQSAVPFVALVPVRSVTPGTDITKWTVSGASGAVLSVNGLVGAVDLAGLFVQPRTASRPPVTSPGRQWITRFEASMANQDNANWTVTNLTRVVDGSRSAAKMTSLATPASCMTKETVRDVDVLVRWRLADTDGTYHLAFAQMAAHGRWVGNGDRISFDYDIWHSGVYPVALTNAANSTIGNSVTGGFSPSAANGTVNATNVTDDRWMRIRVVGGVVSVKHWLATATEPDWQFVRQARGGNAPAGDNLEAGFAGAEMLFNGGFIYEITVTELLPTPEMVVGGRMTSIDSLTGLPVGWTPLGSVGGGTTTIDTPSVVDPWGTTRKVLHINKTTTSGYDGVTLRLYSARRRGQVYTTRRSPEPFAPFSSMVKVSIWSKGSGIVNPSPSTVNLGSAAVLYYFDLAGVGKNQVDSQYYRALGPTIVPNPPIGGTATGPGGIGTWDWFETTWVMPIYVNDDIAWIDIFIGLHDPGSATGELWVSDVSLVPVVG